MIKTVITQSERMDTFTIAEIGTCANGSDALIGTAPTIAEAVYLFLQHQEKRKHQIFLKLTKLEKTTVEFETHYAFELAR